MGASHPQIENLDTDAGGQMGEFSQSAASGMDPAQAAWKYALEYGLFPVLVVLVVLTVLALAQEVLGKR